jgi:hypothetical protein
METNTNEVLGAFHGDEGFAVDWKEGSGIFSGFWTTSIVRTP